MCYIFLRLVSRLFPLYGNNKIHTSFNTFILGRGGFFFWGGEGPPPFRQVGLITQKKAKFCSQTETSQNAGNGISETLDVFSGGMPPVPGPPSRVVVGPPPPSYAVHRPPFPKSCRSASVLLIE